MRTVMMVSLFLCLGASAKAQTPYPVNPINQPPQNDIQMLNDAVAALKTTDPGLASKLNDVASRPGGPSGETGIPGVPSEATSPYDVQTIRAAANSLKSSRPDLSAKLNAYADRLPK